MRRFWDNAALASTPGGQQLLLDDKPMRLPEGPLIISPPALAVAICEEWQNAGQEFNHTTDLPLTQLHTTAAYRVARDRAGIVKSIAAYGETDLLCYRAVGPRPLRERQDQAWQPWLDWDALNLDAPLCVTAGVVHVPQPPSSIVALAKYVAQRSDQELAALGVVVPATGSLVLGLAMIEGALDAVQVHAIATVDEAFQAEFWGSDAEAADRDASLAAEIALVSRYLELARNQDV